MKYICALCCLLLVTAVAKSAFDAETPVESADNRPPVPQKGSGIYGNAWMSLVPTQEYGNAASVMNYIVIVRASNNNEVKRCHSDQKGWFKITLKPGKYSIRAVTWFKNDPSYPGTYYSKKQVGEVQNQRWSKVALHFQ